MRNRLAAHGAALAISVASLWTGPAWVTAQTSPGVTAVPAGKLPRTQRAGVSGLPLPPAPLPHPTTEAQVRQFLAITDAEGNLHRDIERTLQLMRQQAPPYFPQQVLGEIGQKLQAIDLVHLYLPYYQAYLSEQDMGALLAFYRTEAGKHYAAAQPQLVGSANMVLSGTVQGAIQGVMMQHKDEIQNAKKQYDSQKTPGGK